MRKIKAHKLNKKTKPVLSLVFVCTRIEPWRSREQLPGSAVCQEYRPTQTWRHRYIGTLPGRVAQSEIQKFIRKYQPTQTWRHRYIYRSGIPAMLSDLQRKLQGLSSPIGSLFKLLQVRKRSCLNSGPVPVLLRVRSLNHTLFFPINGPNDFAKLAFRDSAVSS